MIHSPLISGILGLGLPLLLAAVIGAGCGSPNGPSSTAQPASPVSAVESQPRFIHTVLFWLKPDTPEQRRDQLIRDCKEILGGIPSVRYLAAGVPAGTPRDVVDNSYQVALVVHFDDAAGHDAYQVAEKHQEFIDRNLDIWERVQVYDFNAR